MNKILREIILGGFMLIVTVTTILAQQRMDQMWGDQQAKNKELKEKRGHLFEWGNYAMFIHWGLFSHLGNVWNGKTYYGIGEWMILTWPMQIGVNIKLSVVRSIPKISMR